MRIKFISMILFFTFASCSFMGDIKEGTVFYYGFDFSSGALNANFEKNDIIAILDYNPSVEKIERGIDLYFLLDSTSLKQDIKDFDEAPFNSIDRVTANFEFDSISKPIIPGHLYVMKCKDGFAKFRVMQIKGSVIYRKEISIQYEFSFDSVF